jgi:hypothetical protein
MCKPNKTGGADKKTPQERQAQTIDEKEIKEARQHEK